MKSTSKRNILIGLTVIVSIALLYWGIEYLKGVNLFKPSNYYYAQFEDVQGLTVSTPVKINGFQVGQVRDIEYDYKLNRITVELSFEKDLKIPKNSAITMGNELLGSATLELVLGRGKNYFQVGDTIPTSVQVGLMDKVGTDMLPVVSSMLPKVDSILGTVNTILSNPAINSSVTRLDAITAQLNQSAAELTTLMAHLNQQLPGLVGNVNGVVTNTDGVMSNAKVLTNDLKTTTANLNQLTASLNKLPLDSTMSRINATLANIQSLTKQLNNKNSSLGMLMNDKQLYQNAANTVASLDSLLQDVKKNPKKYVTIKVF